MFMRVKKFKSKEHFKIIYAENAANSGLTNLPGVEQLELLGSLVEIVAQRYAISPLLDLSRFGPELEVDGGAGAQHAA